MSISGRQMLNLAASLICLLLDLGSKYWAHVHLQPGQSQVFIPGLINLTLTGNTGFAFSIGQGHTLIAQVIAVAIFLALLFVYIQRYYLNHRQTAGLEQFGMSIVIGAALGNLLERLCYGKVTDFFQFTFINFPVFNLADVFIDTGIVLVLISAYGQKSKK